MKFFDFFGSSVKFVDDRLLLLVSVIHRISLYLSPYVESLLSSFILLHKEKELLYAGIHEIYEAFVISVYSGVLGSSYACIHAHMRLLKLVHVGMNGIFGNYAIDQAVSFLEVARSVRVAWSRTTHSFDIRREAE